MDQSPGSGQEKRIPPVQVALDLLDLPRAIKIAEEAVAGGVTYIEAGTPLIKAEGMHAVRELKAKFPHLTIVADMKTMDAGSTEVEMSAKAGASIVFILGVADDSAIREAVLAGKKYGVKIAADLIMIGDPAQRASELEQLGVDIVNIHVGLDQQVLGVDPVDTVRKVKGAVSQNVLVAAAGGLNSETAVQAYEAGADIIIVGGALYKAAEPESSARAIIESLKSGKPVQSEGFHKFDMENLSKAFSIVSTCNISDAMHRTGEMRGLKPAWYGTEERPLKFAGPAVTVRSYAGDWSKTVQAIDECKSGDVLVIDNSGSEIACWGELATYSCLNKGVAAVIIDGAARDIDEIRKMRFPLFARHFSPSAGEPKGFGEINAAIECCGRTVEPGDWIVGDDSGVVVIPRRSVMEIVNRAIDVKEKEDRFREEIRRGSTLAQVAYLDKWEVK